MAMGSLKIGKNSMVFLGGFFFSFSCPGFWGLLQVHYSVGRTGKQATTDEIPG